MSGMTNEVMSATIPASGQLTFSRGRIFNLIAAPNPVSIVLDQAGGKRQASVSTFNNVPAGSVYIGKVGEEWTYLRLTGTVGDLIQIYIGDDEVKFGQAVNVVGVAATKDQPAATITDAPNVAVPNAAQTAVVPINGTRRRVAISFASNAAIGAATVFIRKTGGVNNLIEVQPGVLYSFPATYGLDIRNDSGGALSALIFEES